MKKCLIIGSTVCDVMIYIDKLPLSQKDIHLKNQLISVGGCAFNVVNVLHNLDIPYTFISPVGKGIYGEIVSNKLFEKGIKSDIRVDEENGCCYCLIEQNGDRTFMSYHKAEYRFQSKWLDKYNLNDYSYIYICGLEVEDVDGEELVKSLERFSGQIVFAPGPRVQKINKELINKIFSYKPIVHLNSDELIELVGIKNIEDAIINLFNKTNNTVITTLGRDGAVCFDGEFKYVLGYEANVIDTVGAGDSHVGAIISCMYKNKNLEFSLDFANYLSSKIVEVKGIELPLEIYKNLKNKL